MQTVFIRTARLDGQHSSGLLSSKILVDCGVSIKMSSGSTDSRLDRKFLPQTKTSNIVQVSATKNGQTRHSTTCHVSHREKIIRVCYGKLC
jgi:hypothetical protein